MEEARKKKWASVALIIGAIGFIILSSTYKCNFLGADNKQ